MPESEQRLRAQIAAHTKWANTPDRTSATAPARAALEQRFLNEAGGDPIKAAHLRKAFYAGLTLKSLASRTRRKAEKLTAAAEAVEAELKTLRGDGGGHAA